MTALKHVWILTTLLLTALTAGVGCSKKSKLGDFIATGDKHYEKREFETAKIAYIRALQMQQTNSHVILRLGRIFYEQGQAQQAYPFLLHSRTEYPNEIPVREALATIYAAAGTNLWKAEVDAILTTDPGNEVAIMTLLRTANTPEALTGVGSTITSLRAKAGDKAVFHVADAEIARRRGDAAASEASLRRAIAVEPNSILAHLALGNTLAVDNKSAEALAEISRAAELSPPHGNARLRLAQFHLQNNRIEEATKVLDEINAKAPEVIGAWIARAEVALGMKNYPEARRFLSRATSQTPNDIGALRLQSQIDLAENKPADAVKAMETVVRIAPRSSEFHYQLGVALLLNKDMTRAANSLREAVRLDPNTFGAILLLAELDIARGASGDAITALVDLTRRAPQLGQARMLLGRAYRATGRLDDAVRVYSAMRQNFPSNAPPVFQLGLVLRQKNLSKDARKAFEDCLKLVPDDNGAIEQLVSLDVEAKDFEGALKRIQTLIEKNPKNATPWVLRGKVLAAQKKVPEAEAAFKQALSVESEFQPALLALAELYIAAGKRAEALAELQRAIEKDPKNVGALSLAGMLQVDAGKFKEGQSSYERALQLQPGFVLVLNNLAYLLAEKRGDVEGAYVHATKGRQLAPKSPVIADTLGWIEYKRGNYSQALRLLLDAAEELGGNSEVQFHLGMAHYMMGQEAPARIALEQALKSGTDFEGVSVAKTHLALLKDDPSTSGPSALASLEQRRRDNPNDIVALTRLGSAYATSGDTTKAREAFESALKINTNSVESLTRLASLHARQLNNPARALELARQARQLDPDDPILAQTVARIAFDAGETSFAYTLLQDASRRVTNQAGITHDFALAAFSLGRIEEATNLMSRVAASASDPLQAKARRFLLVVAGTGSASSPASDAAAEQLLQEEPSNAAALFAKARKAERSGHSNDAVQAYEALLKRFPSFTPATRQLALVYVNQLLDDAKAYPLAAKARESLPRDDELAAALGKMAARRGDHRYAIQLLGEASRSQTTDAELQYYLGLSHVALKQVQPAKTALEKAIQLAPQAKFAPDAKKALSTLQGQGG